MNKQKQKVKVTIGLSVYNAERYLKEAIVSILNQTFENFELIIVNDGSKDSSMELAHSFQDNRIKIFDDGLNKGLPMRLNQIHSLAKGSYIARMDADDIMHPDRIKRQVLILEKHPEIDVLGTNAYSIDENNKVMGVRQSINNKTEILSVKSFIHPTIMGKTEWFLVNFYNEKLKRVEDIELWYRTKNKSNFKIVNQPLLFYREFGGSYYKKYQNGIPSMLNISKKYIRKFEFKSSLIWLFISFISIFKYLLYRLFNLLKLEYLLINNRNIEIKDFQKISAIEALEQATNNI